MFLATFPHLLLFWVDLILAGCKGVYSRPRERATEMDCTASPCNAAQTNCTQLATLQFSSIQFSSVQLSSVQFILSFCVYALSALRVFWQFLSGFVAAALYN